MTGRPDRFVFSDVDWQGIVDALQEGVGFLDAGGRIIARAVIRVRDDERVDALAVRGPPFIDLAMREWSPPVEDGMIGRCLRERAPLLVNDVRSSSDYQSTPETADVRSELVAPLMVEGAVWGAINLEELVENAFDDEDAQLLCILANQVAAAIRSAQLVGRLGDSYSGSLNR